MAVKIWPQSECLISRLADELCEMEDDVLAKTRVILPTERLSVYLLAKIATTRGACIPPKVTTLDRFVSEVFPPEQEPSIIGKLSFELLLTVLIKEGAYDHVRPGCENEVKQLFSEIVEFGMGEAAFDRLKDVIASDVYRGDGHVKALNNRFIELSKLYQNVERFLTENHLELSSRWSARHAVSAMEGLCRLDGSGSIRAIYIVGFTTIRPYYRDFYAKLAKKDYVQVWMSHPGTDERGVLAPLEELQNCVGGAPCSYVPESNKPRTQARIVEVEGVFAESHAALKIARRYIAAGVAPSNIAVITSDEAAYGRAFRSILQDESEGTNIALAGSFRESSIGRWVSLFLELFQAETSASYFAGFAAHPLTYRLIGEAQGRDALARGRIYAEVFKATQDWKLDEWSASEQLAPEMISYLTELRQSLQPILDLDSGKGHPLGLLIKTFFSVLRQYIDGIRTSVRESQNFEASALATLEAFKQEFLSFAEGGRTLSTLTEFLNVVRTRLLSQEIRTVGFPLKGIQILSIIEARYVPFEVVILCGCREGLFPRSMPADHLVDDWLKRKIGLPGWQYIESLEETTFQLLAARVNNFNLLNSKSSSGEETVRSRFLEHLIAQKRGVVERWSLSDVLDQFECQQPAIERAPSMVGDYSGSREALYKRVSATSLTALSICPYKFLLHQIGIKESPKKDDRDEKKEGFWLHSILESFYTGVYRGTRLAEPLTEVLTHDDSKIALLAMERLHLLTTKILPESYGRSPLDRHLREFSWPRFIEHWQNMMSLNHGCPPSRCYKELILGRGEGELKARIVWDQNEELMSWASGAVDSLDLYGSAMVLTDYKRKRVPSSADVSMGRDLQLAFYALALSGKKLGNMELDPSRFILGYWSILDGVWHPRAVGKNIRTRAIEIGLATKKTVLVEDLAADTLGRVSQLLRELKDPKNRLEPRPSQACGTCAYQGICRSDDLRYRGMFNMKD